MPWGSSSGNPVWSRDLGQQRSSPVTTTTAASMGFWDDAQDAIARTRYAQRLPLLLQRSRGDVLDWSGDVLDWSGDVLGWSGDVLDWSGDVLDWSGDVLGWSGDVLDWSGDVLDWSGDV